MTRQSRQKREDNYNAVFACINDTPWISAKEISVKTGIHETTVRDYCDKLKLDEKIIQATRVQRGTHPLVKIYSTIPQRDERGFYTNKIIAPSIKLQAKKEEKKQGRLI